VREEIARIDRAIFKPAQPEEIYEALGQWERELLSINQGNLSASQLEQALDAEWMVAELRNSPRESLRGVKNGEGVQAAAAV